MEVAHRGNPEQAQSENEERKLDQLKVIADLYNSHEEIGNQISGKVKEYVLEHTDWRVPEDGKAAQRVRVFAKPAQFDRDGDEIYIEGEVQGVFIDPSRYPHEVLVGVMTPDGNVQNWSTVNSRIEVVRRMSGAALNLTAKNMERKSRAKAGQAFQEARRHKVMKAGYQALFEADVFMSKDAFYNRNKEIIDFEYADSQVDVDIAGGTPMPFDDWLNKTYNDWVQSLAGAANALIEEE